MLLHETTRKRICRTTFLVGCVLPTLGTCLAIGAYHWPWHKAAAQRALELMMDRASKRIAFGRPLIKQQSVREDIALSACQIEQARLLTLKAAHRMDTFGNKGAQDLIAMIKIVAPNMALDVIDRAMQIHGAVGLSQDTPLAHLWAYARTLRLADGPDQVHMMQLGRNLARRQEAGA